MPLRVAAISFLNPAPLLFDFEHEPAATALRAHYAVHYTTPARCAAELHAGVADLGLIPIAQLTEDLHIVPGCTIASQREVRSILLLVRARPGRSVDEALHGLRTIAADSASRSSAAYLRTMLRRFYRCEPAFAEHVADPLAMLAGHDAALLIGDPALLARENRAALDAAAEAAIGDSLLWLDVAELWHAHTGLPWVAAVWAVRSAALPGAGIGARHLTAELGASRDHGLAHTEQLVTEWLPRLALSADTIRTYLSENIYYFLDPPCLEAIRTFRAYAAEAGVLPPLPELQLLTS